MVILSPIYTWKVSWRKVVAASKLANDFMFTHWYIFLLVVSLLCSKIKNGVKWRAAVKEIAKALIKKQKEYE